MGITALQAHGEGLGAAGVGEYRGATTAARFSDPQAEFAALRSGCGVYDLGFRAKISLTRRRSCALAERDGHEQYSRPGGGSGVYAFLLNPQGHILGDLYAYNRGESITVDTDRGQVEKILATFDHYIIMDDVEVTNLSEQMTALGIAGPKAREVLQTAAIDLPDLQPLQFTKFSVTAIVAASVVRSCERRRDRVLRNLAGAEHVRPLWDALVAAGASPDGLRGA